VSAAQTFGPAELARATGCSPDIADLAFETLRPPELLYRPLTKTETAAAVAGIESVIRDKPLRTVGGDDPAVWERGWGELADQLASQRITTHTLRPQYYHGEVPCRLFGGLVEQVTPDFEYWVGLCVRVATFAEFLKGERHIVEFGCGTGINLLLLAQLMPGARLAGCDWATPSQRILAQIARETGEAIEGYRFNMLTASGECGPVGANTTVLTVHALEQVGAGWQPFLDFVIAHRPSLCVHLEPLVELYETAPLDDLARRYHRKRGYLDGFVPAIKALAARGQAEILTLRRTAFSGLYQEAYSVLVWRLRV
jgi:hypothetical protein